MQLDHGVTTMTRLNPLTTPRHDLRAEKARRNKKAALAAFIGKKAEIDGMLARLASLSADHFETLSAVFAPASCSRRIPMICSSVNFDLFMFRSSSWAGPQMEELSGVRALSL